jgi:hypothetical protein
MQAVGPVALQPVRNKERFMSHPQPDKELESQATSPWLDTETKALLQQSPPEKYAPPDTGIFTLVLLRKGNDLTRLAQALARVPGLSSEKAERIVSSCCPLPVARSLSLHDALLGQFELVCCDSISVFVRDEVVWSASSDYLPRLYSHLQRSPEFENVSISVTLIPQSDQGRRFVDQFLGGMSQLSSCPHRGYFCEITAMRKKARIMVHWAKKVGADVTIAGDPSIPLDL